MDPIFPFKILQKIKLKNTRKPQPPKFSFVQGLPGDKGQPGSPGEVGLMVRSSLSLTAIWLEQENQTS